MFSMFLYMTLYLQNALGYSPLQAGLRFLPMTLLSFFVAPIAGKLSSTVPVRLMIGGGLFLSGIALLLDGATSTPTPTGPRCCPGSSSPAWASG